MMVVAIAAFLPWASVFGISASGLDGDGVITLALAVVGLVILAVTAGVVGGARTAGRVSQIVLLVFAAAIVLIGIVDMSGAAAIGIYLTLFGGIAWAAGAGWQLSVSNQAVAVQPSSPDAKP